VGRLTALVTSCYNTYHTFTPLIANNYPDITHILPVNNDCVEVDELILEIADYKNHYADVAAEKLFRKCSTSWQAYQYYDVYSIFRGNIIFFLESIFFISGKYGRVSIVKKTKPPKNEKVIVISSYRR
jgi:hypothetical protein